MTVRVGIIDSGVSSAHPHIGNFHGGACFVPGQPGGDVQDRLGHGTAVAAAIHDLAPGAELHAARVFHSRLSCTIGALVAALDWCLDQDFDLINLSLGTANQERREVLEARVHRANGQGARIITAAGMLPGQIEGALAVDANGAVPRGAAEFADGVYFASPYPRAIPGVPPERNLNGQSFAVANFTGILAAMMVKMPAEEALRALQLSRSSSNPFRRY